MLHIIWLVLKIIGIILLVLLMLLLAALAAVLLVPIRYKAEGSFHGSLVGAAKVTWLLHILSVKAVYDGELDLSFRIFGFRLLKPATQKEEEAEEELILQSQELIRELEEEIVEEMELEPLPPPEEKKAERESGPEAEIEAEAETEASPVFRWWKKQKAALAGCYHHMKEKVLNLKENLDRGKEFIQDEENKKTIKLLWKNGKKLLKHILPRKVKGKVLFGFDDPYITGQVLSAASIFYPLYARQLSVCPVFDQAVFEAEGELKGRIRIGTVLFILIRVYCNKNFRVLLKQWRS